MGLLAEIFSRIVTKAVHMRDKTSFIFYKIVDASETEKKYLLQCINTKATFQASIADIVMDVDILYGLHPVQSCFVGIEYSKEIHAQNMSRVDLAKQQEKLSRYSVHRYGTNKLLFQNRDGKICFINIVMDKTTVLPPDAIALNESLIANFDATQAFYIGLLAGFNLYNSGKSRVDSSRPLLRVVK